MYFWGHGKSDPVVMYEWATRSQKVLKEEYNVNNIEFNSYAGTLSLCFERVSAQKDHRSAAQRLTTRTQGSRNFPEQGHSSQIVIACETRNVHLLFYTILAQKRTKQLGIFRANQFSNSLLIHLCQFLQVLDFLHHITIILARDSRHGAK